VSIWLAENERNARNSELLKDIIREVYGATEVGVGHHIMWSANGKTDEHPSIDTLIFDHHVAQTLWGPEYADVLMSLACATVTERDQMLADFYYGREHEVQRDR
jgi:hypothetical protein